MEGYIIRNYEIFNVICTGENEHEYEVEGNNFKICVRKKDFFEDFEKCVRNLYKLKARSTYKWW